MKQLPDEKILDELLSLAKDFEQQALSLSKRATEIDEHWRVRLESKRQAIIDKCDTEVDNFKIESIIRQAEEIFEDREKARRWLLTPLIALNGQTPLETLTTDEGRKQVRDILFRIEYGIYS